MPGASQTRTELQGLGTRLSVVIPALNEAARVAARLAEVRDRPGVHEVIVVDGGSIDRTVQLATAVPGVRVLRSMRGRARQMNFGAHFATGEVLLFLHVDCRLPAGAIERVHGALSDPAVVAGAFRTRTVTEHGRPAWIRPLLPLADLRSSYTWHPYGDQALFVRTAVFRELGGYRDQPLFEDLELSQRLWRHGRVRVLPQRVQVSARRYVAHPWRTAAMMNTLPVLYRLGVPTPWLARWYRGPPPQHLDP